jgi:hypothetical protein
MKLAIVGTRTFNDYELMKSKLSDLPGIDLIISGGAEGADTLARRYAKEHNIEMIDFLPDWDKYGNAAGPIRNEMIVKACTHIVLFWDGESPGTKSSLEFAKKHKKRYRLIQY